MKTMNVNIIINNNRRRETSTITNLIVDIGKQAVKLYHSLRPLSKLLFLPFQSKLCQFQSLSILPSKYAKQNQNEIGYIQLNSVES